MSNEMLDAFRYQPKVRLKINKPQASSGTGGDAMVDFGLGLLGLLKMGGLGIMVTGERLAKKLLPAVLPMADSIQPHSVRHF